MIELLIRAILAGLLAGGLIGMWSYLASVGHECDRRSARTMAARQRLHAARVRHDRATADRGGQA